MMMMMMMTVIKKTEKAKRIVTRKNIIRSSWKSSYWLSEWWLSASLLDGTIYRRLLAKMCTAVVLKAFYDFLNWPSRYLQKKSLYLLIYFQWRSGQQTYSHNKYSFKRCCACSFNQIIFILKKFKKKHHWYLVNCFLKNLYSILYNIVIYDFSINDITRYYVKYFWCNLKNLRAMFSIEPLFDKFKWQKVVLWSSVFSLYWNIKYVWWNQ